MAYFGVVLPYRQSLKEQANKNADAINEAAIVLLEFHVQLLASKIGTRKLRRMLSAGTTPDVAMRVCSGDVRFNVDAFPAIPAAEGLHDLRFKLARFKVNAILLNQLIDSFKSGARDEMPQAESLQVVISRVDSFIRARNSVVRAVMTVFPVERLFDDGIEEEESTVISPAPKG